MRVSHTQFYFIFWEGRDGPLNLRFLLQQGREIVPFELQSAGDTHKFTQTSTRKTTIQLENIFLLMSLCAHMNQVQVRQLK